MVCVVCLSGHKKRLGPFQCNLAEYFAKSQTFPPFCKSQTFPPFCKISSFPAILQISDFPAILQNLRLSRHFLQNSDFAPSGPFWVPFWVVQKVSLLCLPGKEGSVLIGLCCHRLPESEVRKPTLPAWKRGSAHPCFIHLTEFFREASRGNLHLAPGQSFCVARNQN